MDSERFWSGFAARYDGHMVSREAAGLAPRIASVVGRVERVLDAGCGTGVVALELARVASQVDAADFAEPMLALARSKAGASGLANVTFHRMGVESHSFPDACFDAVVVSNVLHLVADPARALAEARRVLKPSGRLVAPTYCHAEGLKAALLSRVTSLLFGVPVRQRFTIDGLLGKVAAAGFEVTGRELLRFKVPLVFVEARAR